MIWFWVAFLTPFVISGIGMLVRMIHDLFSTIDLFSKWVDYEQ
jgi:hypothetical protein